MTVLWTSTLRSRIRTFRYFLGGGFRQILFAVLRSENLTINDQTFPGPDPDPSAVPLPAALPLLAGGIGLMGLMGWRRRRG